MDQTETPPGGPLTAVLSRRIKPGHEAAFHDRTQGFIRFAVGVPGHLGMDVLRPPAGKRDFTVVARFADEAARRAFTRLPEYREWMWKLGIHCEGDPVIQELSGVASWFTLPERPELRPPSRPKMAAITLLGGYPLTAVLPGALHSVTAAWPPLVTKLLISGLVVAALSWVVMPALTRLFAFWLFTDQLRGGSS